MGSRIIDHARANRATAVRSRIGPHLATISQSRVISDLYQQERTGDGFYMRFMRGEMPATEAVKELLDRTLGSHWHSIRMFSYDRMRDRLESPLESAHTHVITYSKAAYSRFSQHTRTIEQRRRRIQLKEHLYDKSAAELAEFFFLIHNRDESPLNSRKCFQYVTDSAYRRLYVLNWKSAERWYTRVGRQILSKWQRRNTPDCRPPSSFFSVTPLQKHPSQVLFISVVGKDSPMGLASLRFFPDSLHKSDILLVDQLLLPIVNLIAPFIPLYNERVARRRDALIQALAEQHLATVLNHDMNNYLPAVSGAAEKIVARCGAFKRAVFTPSSSMTEILDSAQMILDLTLSQVEGVRQIREMAIVAAPPDRQPSGSASSSTRRHSSRLMIDLVRDAIMRFATKKALSAANPKKIDIWRNLVTDRYVQVASRGQMRLRDPRQQFVMSFTVQELLRNAIDAVGVDRLSRTAIRVSCKRFARRYQIAVSNNVGESNPITKRVRRDFIRGHGDEHVERHGTGRGLAACQYFLKAQLW